MLLMLLRTVVAAGERKHQRVVALEFAELAQGAHVIRQLVVRDASGGRCQTAWVDSFKSVSVVVAYFGSSVPCRSAVM